MWWILIPLIIAGLAAKAKANAQSATTPPTPGTAPAGISEPTEVVRFDPAPAPAQNRSTVTDFQENLASAFLSYSTILRHKLPIHQAPLSGGTSFAGSGGGGGSGYGGGGAGGGRGSVGCPIKGTEIAALGTSQANIEEFESEEWVTLVAGEFVLHATGSHLVYTNDGIISISSLVTGQKIVTTKGERSVSSVAKVKGKATFLKIHVPDSHVYFAGGILSHNKA